jgi:hypothetical protein
MFKFMGAVWDRLWGREAAFNNTATVKVRQTSAGYFWDASPAGGGGTSLQLCVVTQLFGNANGVAFDYFGATPFDADIMEVSGSQIIVAKSITARGPETEQIDGQTIIYSQYYWDTQRLAFNTTTGASEFDSIHNRYCPAIGGEPIPFTAIGDMPDGSSVEQYYVTVGRTANATGVLDGSGNPIYYLEVSPDRKWVYNPQLNGN